MIFKKSISGWAIFLVALALVSLDGTSATSSVTLTSAASSTTVDCGLPESQGSLAARAAPTAHTTFNPTNTALLGVADTTHVQIPSLVPRLPELQPLDIRRADETQKQFVQRLMNKAESVDIGLNTRGTAVSTSPEFETQVRSWTFNTIEGQVGISMSAVWYPFGDEKFTLKMDRMRGCTGLYIWTEAGTWIAHIWESGRPPTGSSALLDVGAFKRWDNLNRKFVERSDDVFQIIVSNLIVWEMAPDEVITRPLFKSLPYIAAQHGNPFSKGAILYIQTPEKSFFDQTPLYSNKVNGLTATIRSWFDHFGYKLDVRTRTYANTLPWSPKPGSLEEPFMLSADMIGVSVIQYGAPIQNDGSCGAMSACQIWLELNPEAIIDEKWLSSGTQFAKRDNDSCATTETLVMTGTSGPVSSLTGPPCSLYSKSSCACFNEATISATSSKCDMTTFPPEALTTPAALKKADLAALTYTTTISGIEATCSNYGLQYDKTKAAATYWPGCVWRFPSGPSLQIRRLEEHCVAGA